MTTLRAQCSTSIFLCKISMVSGVFRTNARRLFGKWNEAFGLFARIPLLLRQTLSAAAQSESLRNARRLFLSLDRAAGNFQEQEKHQANSRPRQSKRPSFALTKSGTGQQCIHKKLKTYQKSWTHSSVFGGLSKVSIIGPFFTSPDVLLGCHGEPCRPTQAKDQPIPELRCVPQPDRLANENPKRKTCRVGNQASKLPKNNTSTPSEIETPPFSDA
ncbi:hypothetical protein IWZ01DRAFT_26782 [Phyllosticta capitalensis]